MKEEERQHAILEELMHSATTRFTTGDISSVRIGMCNPIECDLSDLLNWEYSTLRVEPGTKKELSDEEKKAMQEFFEGVYGKNGELLILTENLTKIIVSAILSESQQTLFGFFEGKQPKGIIDFKLLKFVFTDVAVYFTKWLRDNKNCATAKEWNAQMETIFSKKKINNLLRPDIRDGLKKMFSWEYLSNKTTTIATINASQFNDQK